MYVGRSSRAELFESVKKCRNYNNKNHNFYFYFEILTKNCGKSQDKQFKVGTVRIGQKRWKLHQLNV